MRKLLPSFMGIVTLMWVFGGTVWMSRNICNAIEQKATLSMNTMKEGNQFNQTVTSLSSPIAKEQPVFVSRSIQNTASSFQGLNLYFAINKYRFKATPELDEYFRQLKVYMSLSPQHKIKVSIFGAYTEGGDISAKRMTFFKNFLDSQYFDLKRFDIEVMAIKQDENIDSAKIMSKNQRIEIRKM